MWLKLLSLVSGFTNVLLVQEFYIESSLILLNKKKINIENETKLFFYIKKNYIIIECKRKKIHSFIL